MFLDCGCAVFDLVFKVHIYIFEQYSSHFALKIFKDPINFNFNFVIKKISGCQIVQGWKGGYVR